MSERVAPHDVPPWASGGEWPEDDLSFSSTSAASPPSTRQRGTGTARSGVDRSAYRATAAAERARLGVASPPAGQSGTAGEATDSSEATAQRPAATGVAATGAPRWSEGQARAAPAPGSRRGRAGSLPQRPRSAARPVNDVLLMASGWVLLAAIGLGAPVALRTLLSFAFVLFAPGAAIRSWLPARRPLERVVYTIAASLSVSVLATLVLALGHLLTTDSALYSLAGFTSVAAADDLVTSLCARRRERAADG